MTYDNVCPVCWLLSWRQQLSLIPQKAYATFADVYIIFAMIMTSTVLLCNCLTHRTTEDSDAFQLVHLTGEDKSITGFTLGMVWLLVNFLLIVDGYLENYTDLNIPYLRYSWPKVATMTINHLAEPDQESNGEFYKFSKDFQVSTDRPKAIRSALWRSPTNIDDASTYTVVNNTAFSQLDLTN